MLKRIGAALAVVALLAWATPPAVNIQGYYYVVSPAGDTVSRHTSYHVGLEAASNQALANPGAHYRLRADLDVSATNGGGTPPPPPPPSSSLRAMASVSCDGAGTCQFDGRASTGAIAYSWRANAGAGEQVGTTPQLTHHWASTTVGTMTWALIVTDAAGRADTSRFSFEPYGGTELGVVRVEGLISGVRNAVVADGRTLVVCTRITFGDGHQALRAADPAACHYMVPIDPSLRATAAQQVVADARCLDLTITKVPGATGTARFVLPQQPCDRVSVP